MTTNRLQQQIEFLIEIDKVKKIIRQTYITDASRKENDAEHSWHLAMAVIVLAEHAAEPVDVTRVVKMVLIHDLVEIDAGDVIVYDRAARLPQKAKEQAAADRIYALLPADQARELRSLWEEFEARQTPEAKFAGALDRLLPILLNAHTGGRSWRERGVTADRVREFNAYIADGSPAIWEFVQKVIDRAVEKGHLSKGP